MSGPLPLVEAPYGVGDGAAGSVVRLPQARGVAASGAVDPVVELAERLAGPCAGAAHADEIAALLESEGLTDEQITERYGHRDLFTLAEALFALVPRAYPEPEPGTDPWQTDAGRCVLRGLTFALPGVAYVVGGRWADGPGGPFGLTAAVAGWAAAALCSWSWNQGLAHRAGLLLLAQRPRAAARCLLTGGAAGTVLATAAAVAVTGLARPSAPAFAFGQALYMAAATVLLVLSRERSLLYVLVPLTVSAACGAGGLPSPAVAALLTATVAAATAAAVITALRPAGTGRTPIRRALADRLRTRRAPTDASPPGARSLATRRRRRGDAPRTARRTPREGATPAASETAAVTTPLHPAGTNRTLADRLLRGRRAPAGDGPPRKATRLRRRGGPPSAAPHGAPTRVPLRRSVPLAVGGLAAGGMVLAAALAGEFVAALTVSMGVAEWLLFRLRSRSLVALRRTGVADRLLRRSWPVLARCLGAYAAALAALAGVESAALPGAAAWDAPHLGVLLALGCMLWLALLLQSCGRPWTAAAVLCAATGTAVPLLAAHTGSPGTVIGLAGAGAAAVLLAAATTVTARVTTHR
ncbi:hypothetical protein [Actinacidiphila paucisporea]|uniref:Uncharacterized protein n=1 Tax=Actinacidiphila paucisporea TaxID=310782 RepID=A0A1M7AA20_9ACTN|nr:hypothetical protein [Actinacidiphila paucisporea]SHL39557.1 hypothetical protein SAMN05216499_10432 [Actinacidiphila paucisporea]